MAYIVETKSGRLKAAYKDHVKPNDASEFGFEDVIGAFFGSSSTAPTPAPPAPLCPSRRTC